MYVVRVHPHVILFSLGPRSPYSRRFGLLPSCRGRIMHPFAYNGSNFALDNFRMSPLAFQQQESFLKRIHCLFLRTPLRIFFDLTKYHCESIDLSAWRVDPYLGSDDLRDPDSERSNPNTGLPRAPHAPSVKGTLLLVSNVLCRHVRSFNTWVR